tara:strand:- start:18 stop:413 length:396 start_codon:yes stop_codon:yes gene_type:complete
MSKQKTFQTKKMLNIDINAITEEIEQEFQEMLGDVADTLVNKSPVKSGAYVNSHSVKANSSSNRGRGHTKHGRPLSDRASEHASGRAKMQTDIEMVELKRTVSVTFRNDAPHAGKVETKHGVYQQIRNMYG